MPPIVYRADELSKRSLLPAPCSLIRQPCQSVFSLLPAPSIRAIVYFPIRGVLPAPCSINPCHRVFPYPWCSPCPLLRQSVPSCISLSVVFSLLPAPSIRAIVYFPIRGVLPAPCSINPCHRVFPYPWCSPSSPTGSPPQPDTPPRKRPTQRLCRSSPESP